MYVALTLRPGHVRLVTSAFVKSTRWPSSSAKLNFVVPSMLSLAMKVGVVALHVTCDVMRILGYFINLRRVVY